MRLTTPLFLLLTLTATAEHLPGGSITTRCIGSNQHEVTLQLWRECTGAAMIAQGLTFSNSCGVSFTLNNIPLISVENVSPVCPDQIDQTTCNGGTLIGIELYTYRTTLFLSPCNFWTISWNTCCRQESINLVGSQGVYLETVLNNAGGACNESPVFSDPVPPFVCLGQPVSYDLGVTASADQQLRFRFIDARRYIPEIVSVDYLAPYTGATPFTGMTIDSLSGNITFTPTLQGYIVAVVEVRYSDSNGNLIGTVMRDFPFVAQSCANQVPDATSGVVENASSSAMVTGDYALSTCGGDLCFDAAITDGDAGQGLTLTSNVDQVLPGASFSVSGTNPATASICWNADGAAPGSYSFTINAVDDACPVVGSQTFTYTVTVNAHEVSPGVGNSIVVCPQAGSFALADSLLGSADPGGAWSYEGASVPDLFDPALDPAGDYCYTVTSAACGDLSACITVDLLPLSDPICLAMGLDEQPAAMLRLHPNPSAGQLRVTLPGAARLEVLDGAGRVVWQGQANAGSHAVTLPATMFDGSYALRVSGFDGSIRTERFELLR
ncbi:MAG: hypothetical protein H6591_02765 [Flavobacteriales bacterium]|nr:hypothetical protein [Flavobacteriales bacterium]